MTPPPIHLDNAATTRPFEHVVEEMARVARDPFGNPSSPHGFGKNSKRRLEDAREFLRGSLGAARLIFTSGGTEADYLGIVGAAMARKPGRVLVGAADHAAVLALGPALSVYRHKLQQVPVSEDGDIDPETLFEQLGPDVSVVSLLHGHNELGTLTDLDELVGVIRHVAPEAHIHVDLVQAYAKIDFDLDLAGVDSVAVSAHKFHGPRGVGFLACGNKTTIQPIMAGGGQEDGMRGGTENVAGVVGMAWAAEHMLSHLDGHRIQMEELADHLMDGLAAELPDVERLGHPERHLPHVVSLRFPGVNAQSLQEALNAEGIAISRGSACHGEGSSENHVLKAIGLNRKEAREVVRVSFSCETTRAEVDALLDTILEEHASLQSAAPTRSKRSRR